MSYSCCDFFDDVMSAIQSHADPKLVAAAEAEVGDGDNVGPMATLAVETINALAAKAAKATPDLLAALRGLLDAMEPPRSRKASDAWDAARNAIAKAEGRS